jgi:hypothetical protein
MDSEWRERSYGLRMEWLWTQNGGRVALDSDWYVLPLDFLGYGLGLRYFFVRIFMFMNKSNKSHNM